MIVQIHAHSLGKEGSSRAYESLASIFIVELHLVLPVNKSTGVPWGYRCMLLDVRAAQGLVE